MRPLHAAHLRERLGLQFIGREIVTLAEITSTNDVISDLVAKGAAPGLVVFAERQTAGRGQHGRRWESSAGLGLWFSILLQPQLALRESARLTHWLADTVSSVIAEETSLAPCVKPPNDVYLRAKKVAGVLVEMRAVAGANHRAIAGVGLNVNHAVCDFPHELQTTATSLSLEAGRPIDREGFALALLRELDRRYRALEIAERV